MVSQIKWIGIFQTEIIMIAGPGQIPPIPQPKPKQALPRINGISIVVLFGSNSYPPKKGCFLKLIIIYLTLRIYVKKMILIRIPHPKTNKREGFHPSPISRNDIMLTLRIIPATRRPIPKRTPTTNVIIWSIRTALPIYWSFYYIV